MTPNVNARKDRSASVESAESFVHVDPHEPNVNLHIPTDHEIKNLDYVYLHLEEPRWQVNEDVLSHVEEAMEIMFGQLGAAEVRAEMKVIRVEGGHAFLRVPLKSAVMLRCAVTAAARHIKIHKFCSTPHTLCVNSERFVHQ